MGLKKAMGILVFSTQAVVGYDYYIQTRDAGLNWGDLSATDYGTIVQDRIARARAARDRTASAPDSAGSWDRLAALGTSPQPPEQQAVCIRRSTETDC